MTVISIGAAALSLVGLAPARIRTAGSGRAVVIPTFGGNDIQLTGADPETTDIEARTIPHVTGGMTQVALLRAYQRDQTVVPLIRMGGYLLGTMLGDCVVVACEVDEERLHPATGVGRQLSLHVTLLHTAGAFGWGGR